MKATLKTSLDRVGLGKLSIRRLGVKKGGDSSKQALDVYWDPKMAQVLETWGKGTAWDEIQFLMVGCSGKVLDIACGTGKTMEMLSKFKQIDVHGCDISDFLIQRAIDRGISSDHLIVCDATQTNYPDLCFDYSYSIGSLEHFTEEGIRGFLAESYRISRVGSFHMIPVTRSGKNEGWITPLQSYHNNSVEWWLSLFRTIYPIVHVLDSHWNDRISFGKWIIAMKGDS